MNANCRSRGGPADRIRPKLGELRSPDPRVGQMLVEGMEHDDPAVRVASLRALRATTGDDLGADPKPWREMVQTRLAAEGGAVERR